jgi:PAS domain S-box-containing protein
VRETDQHAADTGEPAQLEYRIRGGNGEWIWVDNRSVLMRDEQGRPLAWHGALLDISERKRLEASLHDSQERFQRAFEDAAIGMSLGTPDDVCLNANAAYCRIVGRPREALIGRTFTELTHPGDVATYTRQHARLYAGEVDSYEIEKRYLHPDGTVVTGLLTVSAVRDGQGRHLYDIAVVDDEMRLIYLSPSADPVFGIPAEQILGPIETGLRFVHAEDQEQTLALFDAVAGQPRAVTSAEVRIKHVKLGWRWYQITIMNLLEDPSICGYLFNLRDITDRKHAELASQAALQAQQVAIAELERLNQSKTRFLSTISHEFRTPLTAIIGYSELLASNIANPAIADDAAIIHREASRLNRLVDDILLVDRADAGQMRLKMTPVDVNALIRDVVATFRPLTDSHRFPLELDPFLHMIDGDRDRLAQAITNLVSNAVKYSPAGGAVTIATHEDGDDVVISVRDEGIGIAGEDLSRIFDRFERVETGIAGRIAGTGLGLSIAQEIASLHEGRLWAESKLGLGSTFYLALPATTESEVGSRK